MDEKQRTFTEEEVRDIVNRILGAQAVQTVALICSRHLPDNLASALVESLAAAEHHAMAEIAAYQLKVSPHSFRRRATAREAARRFVYLFKEYQSRPSMADDNDLPF